MAGILAGLATRRSRGGAAAFMAVAGITMVTVPLVLAKAGDAAYGLSFIVGAYINTLVLHWEKALLFVSAFLSVFLIPRSSTKRRREREVKSIVIRLE